MNPFTESTVARPLPKDHDDCQWTGAVVEDRAPGRPFCDATKTDDNPGGNAGALKVIGDAGKKSQSGRRCTSAWAALSLAASLMMSAMSVPLPGTAAISGVVATAAILMPRAAQAIDLNKATIQELQGVKGIGPKTASMIVDERTRGGNFASLTDLSERVRGIGPKKAAALQAAGLTVGSGASQNNSDTKGAARRSRQ